MKEFTANRAKTQFGRMLLKARQSPFQITKNGNTVAVVVSMNVYHGLNVNQV